jgi:hypothetical protein
VLDCLLAYLHIGDALAKKGLSYCINIFQTSEETQVDQGKDGETSTA